MTHQITEERRGRRRHEDGQALVELALVMPLLLIFLTGIIQFGLLFNTYITLTDAVRAGARTLALDRGLDDPCDKAVSQTLGAASGTNLTAGEVTTSLTSPDTCGSGSYPSRTGGSMVAGDEATVSVAVPYTITVFGMSLPSFTLSASASNEIE